LSIAKGEKRKGIGTAPTDPNLKTLKNKCFQIDKDGIKNRLPFPRAQFEGTLLPNPGRKKPVIHTHKEQL
jgi:hypothetical protein